MGNFVKNVGVIGLGSMGMGIAKSLIKIIFLPMALT